MLVIITTDILWIRLWHCNCLIADQSTSNTEPGCVGHAGQAAVPGNTDPRLGYCVFRSSAVCQRRIAAVCHFFYFIFMASISSDTLHIKLWSFFLLSAGMFSVTFTCLHDLNDSCWGLFMIAFVMFESDYSCHLESIRIGRQWP